MESSINIDLFPDRLRVIKVVIEEFPDLLIREDLWSFHLQYRKYNTSLDQLKQELKSLVLSKSIKATYDECAAVDALVPFLIHGDDCGIASRARDLLHYIYAEFENAVILDWISNRFAINKEELLEIAKPSETFGWLMLWMVYEYPSLASFLFGKVKVDKFLYIKGPELKRLILHLPQFVLWGIDGHIQMAKHRFIIKKLAQGLNIRRIPGCSEVFTKRMAHCFTNAPKACSFKDAMWYAIVFGLGGNQVLLTVLRNHFNTWEDKVELLRTLIAFFTKPGSEVEMEEFQYLLGYLQHVFDENGRLLMKSWTLNSLRRRTDQWYAELEQRREEERARLFRHNPHFKQSNLNATWEGANYNPLEFDLDGVIYRIEQLTSTKALQEEGRKMRHCVSSYVSKCINHNTSIWSLRQEKEGHISPMVTIEISKNHVIVQAKRKLNAEPESFQWKLIRKWATLEGLEIN